MIRLSLALAAALLALPATTAIAQAPAPATPQQPGRDIPMARLMSDGAQVRGADNGQIILQLGKFVFSCRYGEANPTLCNQIP